MWNKYNGIKTKVKRTDIRSLKGDTTKLINAI